MLEALAKADSDDTTNGVDFASVMVLAPWFPIDTDLPIPVPNGVSADDIMLWDGSDPDGPWRYGAGAVTGGTNVSSFAVLDQMIHHLNNRSMFPNLQHIAVAGHSSGGQMVRLWFSR